MGVLESPGSPTYTLAPRLLSPLLVLTMRKGRTEAGERTLGRRVSWTLNCQCIVHLSTLPRSCQQPCIWALPGLWLQPPRRCLGLSPLGTSEPGSGLPCACWALGSWVGIGWGSLGTACPPLSLTSVLTLSFSLCCAQPIPWDLWEVSCVFSVPAPRGAGTTLLVLT